MQTKPQQPRNPAGDFDQLPSSSFVRLPTVCALFSIAPATAWRWAKAGQLPAPRKIGRRVSAWNVGELRAALTAVE